MIENYLVNQDLNPKTKKTFIEQFELHCVGYKFVNQQLY